MNGVRRLSGKELLRLQGFPEDFEIVGNMMQIRKQTGNSVAIPVVHTIVEKMLQALHQRKPMIQPEEQLLLSTSSEFDDFFNTRGYRCLTSIDFWQV